MSNNDSTETEMGTETKTDNATECEKCGKPPKGVTMGAEMEGWNCPFCYHYNELQEVN